MTVEKCGKLRGGSTAIVHGRRTREYRAWGMCGNEYVAYSRLQRLRG
jgi:hypothetical protein